VWVERPQLGSKSKGKRGFFHATMQIGKCCEFAGQPYPEHTGTAGIGEHSEQGQRAPAAIGTSE
jgi:hypothetical protein